MRLVILGGPGAGKGTQAEQLSSALDLVKISTGDILRNAIAAQTELGKQVQAQVEQGDLVSDERMIDFIREHLLQLGDVKGWILEGYPRTAFQAEELDFLLDELNQRLDYALSIEVPDLVLVNRSLMRARADDTPEAIQRRIGGFREHTAPLLEYYALRDQLLTINGNQPIEQVHHEILKKLGLENP